jgi:cobalt-zinc-cadmium resistance protein CzcA
MGREFVPSLDEQDIALHAMRIPGTSLSQAVRMQHAVEDKLNEIPEIQSTYSKIGTAEIANDPMPPNVADGFVIVKPRFEWPDPAKPKSQLVEEIEEKLQELPGNNYEFTQPVEMRFNELIAGVRSDLAVKVFGDDMDQLLATGEKIADSLKKVPGASDVKVEQVAGLPMLSIEIDRAKLARYGVPMKNVQDTIQIAIGGRSAGQIFEGDRRFDIVARLPEDLRNDEAALRKIPLLIPGHGHPSFMKAKAEADHLVNLESPRSIPLESVAEFIWTLGPNQISRENGKRRVVVTANIRGRDIGAFVEDAKKRLAREVNIPAGYWIDWGVVVHYSEVSQGFLDRLFRSAIGANRRNSCAATSRHSVVDFSGSGFYRLIRYRSAEWFGDDHIHSGSHGERDPHGPSGQSRITKSFASCFDDCSGGFAGLRADGAGSWSRSRSATTTGYRGDWRDHILHCSHAVCVACPV